MKSIPVDNWLRLIITSSKFHTAYFQFPVLSSHIIIIITRIIIIIIIIVIIIIIIIIAVKKSRILVNVTAVCRPYKPQLRFQECTFRRNGLPL
jgi:hypothetical protein